MVRLNSRRTSWRRLRIWACAETSSEETGSSQNTNLGFKASAAAMPTR
jgi:hypothetical protein